MYYHIEEMDGFCRISSPENVFCYLIVGTEKAMLIDTGYCYADLRAAVRSWTDKPLVIVNTHGHCDHAGGNAQFSELCYLHTADWELCREHTAPKTRRDNAVRARHSMDFATGQECDALPEGFDLDAYGAMGTGNLIELHEGDVFDLGGATLTAVETPGHTRGCVSLLYLEKNIVFTGDAANAFLWLFSDETTDRATYIRSLEKLRGIGADAYWGGHSPIPAHVEDIELYKRAAQEADYAKGTPFESPFNAGIQPRICTLDGQPMDNMFRPGFAAIVIGPDK